MYEFAALLETDGRSLLFNMVDCVRFLSIASLNLLVVWSYVAWLPSIVLNFGGIVNEGHVCSGTNDGKDVVTLEVAGDFTCGKSAFCDTVDREGLAYGLFFAISLLFSEFNTTGMSIIVGCALFNEEGWTAVVVTVSGCALTSEELPFGKKCMNLLHCLKLMAGLCFSTWLTA